MQNDEKFKIYKDSLFSIIDHASVINTAIVNRYHSGLILKDNEIKEILKNLYDLILDYMHEEIFSIDEFKEIILDSNLYSLDLLNIIDIDKAIYIMTDNESEYVKALKETIDKSLNNNISKLDYPDLFKYIVDILDNYASNYYIDAINFSFYNKNTNYVTFKAIECLTFESLKRCNNNYNDLINEFYKNFNEYNYILFISYLILLIEFNKDDYNQYMFIFDIYFNILRKNLSKKEDRENILNKSINYIYHYKNIEYEDRNEMIRKLLSIYKVMDISELLFKNNKTIINNINNILNIPKFANSKTLKKIIFEKSVKENEK